MRFPLETDYSLRIMQTLAGLGSRCDAKQLSEKCSISPSVALKLLKKLHSAGLVQSHPGKSGGFELSKSAHDISLYDIVLASGENVNINICVDCKYECGRYEHKENCFFHCLFGQISDDLREKLLSTSLSQTVGQI